MNGDDESALNLSVSVFRLSSLVTIEKPMYKVDFGVANSIGLFI